MRRVPELLKCGSPRRKEEAGMRDISKQAFDPKSFLTEVGPGRTVQDYRKNQIMFAQGEVADSVLYIQTGRVKLTVISEQGKEAVVAILESNSFSANVA